jgi:hypothetical protein
MSQGFTQAIAKRLTGCYVEICHNMEKQTKLQIDQEHRHQAVIRGILLEVDNECLIVLHTDYKTGEKTQVFINSWSVVSMIELKSTQNLAKIYEQDQNRLSVVNTLSKIKPYED